jgi:hypothetical protein
MENLSMDTNFPSGKIYFFGCVCVSIVRSGILDPWPRSPGFGP